MVVGLEELYPLIEVPQDGHAGANAGEYFQPSARAARSRSGSSFMAVAASSDLPA